MIIMTRNFNCGVATVLCGNIEMVQLFKSEKEAKLYTDALLLVYSSDEVIFLNKKECLPLIEKAEKMREQAPFSLLSPRQYNQSAWKHIAASIGKGVEE